MKIVAINRHHNEPVGIAPALDVMADSSIVYHGKPLFLPDFAPAWRGELYVALRLSRLGKDVSLKFAPRYYDAATVALRLRPVWDTDDARGIDSLFDYSLSIGPWTPIDRLANKPWGVEIDLGSRAITTEITPEQIAAPEAIVAVSRYATVKMGDILLPCMLPVEIPAVAVGDVINATLHVDGESFPGLNARVK